MKAVFLDSIYNPDAAVMVKTTVTSWEIDLRRERDKFLNFTF